MSELSPDARKLFEAARKAYAPDASRLAKVSAALGAQIGVSLASPPAVAATGKVAGAHVLAGFSTTKIVGFGIAAVGLAGATWAVAPHLATRSPAQVDAARSIVAASVPAPRPATKPGPAPAIAREERPVATAVRGAKAPVARAEVPAARSDAPAASRDRGARPARNTSPEAIKVYLEEAPPAEAPEPAPPVALPSRDTLAEEVALVRGARTALDAGDPGKAIALSNRHAAIFPHGALEQERLGIRALALCAAGRTAEAHAATASLRRAAPHSPVLARLGASCK